MSYGITVSVTNPCVCNEKFGKFMSYKINSESTKSGFRPGGFTVDRRYSDFTWLQSEFARELPGCILPPLPEKQAVGRFTPDFIEMRRRALERYLLRVISHPELGSSHLLVIFLQSDDAAYVRAKEDSKANRPKMGSSAVSWMEGKVNNMAYGKATLERTVADDKVDEVTEYVGRLEKQVVALVKHSEALVRRWRETCVAMYDFSQGLKTIDTNSVGADTQSLGSAAERQSGVWSSLGDAESARFTEPLDDYVRLLQNVRAAIAQRAEKRQVLLAAMTDVDVKSAQLRKAQGTPGKDTSGKEQSATTAEAVRDAAKTDFERVTDRLLREFESFQQRQTQDWREMLNAYVETQIEHLRRAETIWDEVAPALQTNSAATKVSFGSASYPSSPPPVPASAPPPPPGSSSPPPEFNGYGSSRPNSARNPFEAPASPVDDEEEGDFAGV